MEKEKYNIYLKLLKINTQIAHFQIRNGNKTVGELFVQDFNDESKYLDYIYIREEYRKKRIASKALVKLFELYPNMVSIVFSFTKYSKRFWTRFPIIELCEDQYELKRGDLIINKD